MARFSTNNKCGDRVKAGVRDGAFIITGCGKFVPARTLRRVPGVTLLALPDFAVCYCAGKFASVAEALPTDVALLPLCRGSGPRLD